MKRIKELVILSLVVMATLPFSASAVATPPAVGPATPDDSVVVEATSMNVPQVAYQGPGVCRHAWMRINAHSITVRETPSATAPAVGQLTGSNPIYWACRHFVVGGGYTACGAANTGWVLISLIHANPPYELQGWIPNQCTQDPILG